MAMHLHTIDYGCGVAQLWADVPEEEVEKTFHNYANECFGIRKSLLSYRLVHRIEQPLPEYWVKIHPTAVAVLKHSGDTIVWGPDGEKLKSEWDG